MFLMIYARIGLLYFRVQFSRRTVVVVQTPGLLCADAQTASCRHWLMGYVRPPPLIFTSFLFVQALSQQNRGQPSSFGFFFLFSSLGMGDARGPLALLSLRPTHRCPRVEEREGEGERGEGQTKSFRRCEETHTSLCFHLSGWWTIILTTWLRKEKTHGFLYHSLRCDGNKLQS